MWYCDITRTGRPSKIHEIKERLDLQASKKANSNMKGAAGVLVVYFVYTDDGCQ